MSKTKKSYLDILKIVPPQYTGKEVYATASADLKNFTAALDFYNVVKERFMNVGDWDKLVKMTHTKFEVADTLGQLVNRKVTKSDYLRIQIPAPHPNDGDCYDWVKVEELKEVSEPEIKSIGFRVRPAASPVNPEVTVDHFYDRSSTSSFILTLHKNKVIMSIVDRNLKPNDKGHSIIDRIRNTIVGTTALAGFSRFQWQKLAESLIKRQSVK